MTYDEGKAALLLMWKLGHPASDQSAEWMDGEPVSLLGTGMSSATFAMLPHNSTGASHNGNKDNMGKAIYDRHVSRYILPYLVAIMDQIDLSTAPGPLKISDKLRAIANSQLLEGDKL